MSSSSEVCKNCDTPLHGEYCSACGQRDARRLELRRLLGDLKGQLFGLDFRVARTLRDLFADPRAILGGYVEGRRVRYTNPIKTLFVAATLYTAVVTLLDVPLSPNPESRETAGFVVAFVNYLVFLFLVPTAWIHQLLFRRERSTWAESYAVLAYVWTGYLLLATLGGVAVTLLDVGGVYFYVRMASGLVFVIWCLFRLHGRGAWGSAWRGAALYLAYFVASAVVMTLLITLSYVVGFEALQVPLPDR